MPDPADDLFADVPWPAAGDVLFADGPDPWMNAQLSLSRFGEGAYSAGYREAGDVLVARAAAAGGTPDLLVYPIVFCYRQYLEPELKDLIKIARRVHGIEHVPLTTHNLATLWKVARDLIDFASTRTPRTSTTLATCFASSARSIRVQWLFASRRTNRARYRCPRACAGST
jgi:hypothetical protein